MNDIQAIQNKIYEIRGQRVMLDFDLAAMYGVETRALNQAVRRNVKRFPEDFMFQVSEIEWQVISSQFVMTSRTKRPKSALPLAITEHRALMLSSVQRTAQAWASPYRFHSTWREEGVKHCQSLEFWWTIKMSIGTLNIKRGGRTLSICSSL